MDPNSDGDIPECSYVELFKGTRLQPLAKAQSSGYQESWKRLEESLHRRDIVPSRYSGYRARAEDPNPSNFAFCCFSDSTI